MTKKELEEIRKKKSFSFIDSLSKKNNIKVNSMSEIRIRKYFNIGFTSCSDVLLPIIEHLEKMKDSHWQGLMNCLGNNGVLEKNVLELLEENKSLKQIIKDYEEALENFAIGFETLETRKAREVLKKHRGNE